MDKEGRHFEACCILRVLSQEYPCVKASILSYMAVARVQQAAVTPASRRDIAVRN